MKQTIRSLRPLAAALITCLPACLPLSAHATSGVTLNALANDYGVGNPGSSGWYWNMGNPGADNYATAGSGSASGSATAAAAQALVTGTTLNGNPNSALSVASGDLSTATVSATQSNSGYGPVRYVNGQILGGDAFAEIYDTLTFTAAAGATDSTVTTVGLTFTVDSSMLKDSSLVQADGSGSMWTTFSLNGVGDARASLYYDPTSGAIDVGQDTYPSGITGAWSVTGDSDKQFTFTYQFSFTGTSFTSAFDEKADLVCYNGIECASTASISFDLDSGVTMSSESGVFLSGSAAPVPEPGTIWLTLAGLAALGFKSRQSQRGRGPFLPRG